MAKRIAIITGASSGLGREFIKQLDLLGEDLFPAEEDGLPVRPFDAFWVIARRKDRLEELAEGTKTPVRVLPCDLTDKKAVSDLAALLEKEQPDVRLLINAAGFGKIGSWRDIPLEQVDQMIDLNCRAAVDMTQICLPHMQADAHVMEICSTAAFQPFQYLNVYAASKAFLYRYSRALSMELRKDRIHVTAVCPYWIKDTEFIPVAQKTERVRAASTAFPLRTRWTTSRRGRSPMPPWGLRSPRQAPCARCTGSLQNSSPPTFSCGCLRASGGSDLNSYAGNSPWFRRTTLLPASIFLSRSRSSSIRTMRCVPSFARRTQRTFGFSPSDSSSQP